MRHIVRRNPLQVKGCWEVGLNERTEKNERKVFVLLCWKRHFKCQYLPYIVADSSIPRCSWLYSPAAQLAMVGAALSSAWVRIRVSIYSVPYH